MRRNRHKHHVHVFCHMFCGWQLINDFEELQNLKAGTLEINVKNGTCIHNGKNNTVLSMPKVLNGWFTDDLKQHKIEPLKVQRADLVVKFNMNEFGIKGGKSPEFNCKAILETGGTSYELEFQGEHGNNEVKIT